MSVKELVLSLLIVFCVSVAVSRLEYDRRIPAVHTEDGLDLIGKIQPLPTECAVVRKIEAEWDRRRNLVVTLACEMGTGVPFRTGEFRYNAIVLDGQNFGLQRLAQIGIFRNGKWELKADVPADSR